MLVREMLNKIKNKKIIFTLIIIFLIIAVIIIVALESDIKNAPKASNKAENQSIKEETKEKSIEATKEYYCPEGFTLNGTICNSTIETVAVKTYDCDEGIPIVTTGECSTYVKEYAEPIWYCITTNPLWPENVIEKQCSEKGYARNLLGCPLGYGPDENNTCSKLVEKRVPAPVKYICPDDYKVVGDKCQKTTSVKASYRLKCPNGYKLVGLKCREN